MNATAKLFGTTYNVKDINGEIGLEGPRGGFYLLVGVRGHDNVFILNSIISGEKRIKGNRAFVALVNGELVEAGRFGRIELPEVEVAEEAAEAAEMVEFNNEVAAMIDAASTPSVEATVEALRQMILDGIRGGQDFDAAYAGAVAAMVTLDRDAMARMATHIIQGER